MKTIEQKFQDLLNGSLAQRPKPLSESEIAEHRVTYFAAHGHMFEKVTSMNSLPDDQISQGIDVLEAEIKAFFIDNPKPDPVTDTHVGDTPGTPSTFEPTPKYPETLSEAQTRDHTKAAVNDLVSIHQEYAELPQIEFVTALNARITVYCAALRPLAGEAELASYLHAIAQEKSIINIDVMTESEAGALKEVEGQSLH